MELKWRIWFEKDGKHVMGKGGAEILRAIKEHGSLAKAAKALGMSYRFAWKYVTKMEKTLGEKIVERERGGREGGGAKLTKLGEEILRMYEEAERLFSARSGGVETLGRVEIRDGERVIVLKLPDIEAEEGDEVRLRVWL
ncbi:winged helix-turn-helix domain-containing protein [Archaeoglobus veneficus]|uniref:Putative transcriptional regulator, ModE family n=1 Tax=Archaeoglobus veneficus (strain DSM 11195 / SNP6) TaxID=693661 RepID=F2KQL4_ARCVS|nr:LysR family transcriptional regulator [Archaeoglobus veneficus]AEA47747.1 putative transcriptional regulator, ModE family [Archaeoglobus veneficus SNP6]